MRFVAFGLIVLSLISACKDSTGDQALVSDIIGTAQDDSTRTDIEQTLNRTYQLINGRQFDELFQMYSADWRSRCSYDGLVTAIDEVQGQGVTDLRIESFTKVDYLGDSASAEYYVVGFNESGEQTAGYDYAMRLTREDGDWKLEERCFD